MRPVRIIANENRISEASITRFQCTVRYCADTMRQVRSHSDIWCARQSLLMLAEPND